MSSRFISLYLHRDLRADRDKTTYLKKVKSHYNYRLIAPEKNLVTKQDCEEVNGFVQFLINMKTSHWGVRLQMPKEVGYISSVLSNSLKMFLACIVYHRIVANTATNSS